MNSPWVIRAVRVGGLLGLCLAAAAPAAVHYVDVNSAAPASPYTNWASAAAVIQDAVDAADPGDQILVTNGVYQTGGRVVHGLLTTRLAVNKAVTVQSVNGTSVTVIQGYQEPGTFNGDSAVRCVYLTNNAVLAGFTLTNGATRNAGDVLLERSGGGAWCESNAVLSACVIVGNRASDSGGGVNGGILNDCTLTGNSAGLGGGARDGTLNNCVLSGNSAGGGGGVLGGTLNSCVLTNNSASAGGGAGFCTLTNCLLAGNLADQSGGGAYAATADHCTFTNNWANSAGGAGFCTLNNCVLAANSANWGGGSVGGTVIHCTITGNFAYEGAGVSGGALSNCIVYYNFEPAAPGAGNYIFGEIPGGMSYCCTTPSPGGGVGNITAEPALASASHLSAGSPCRGAGSAASTSGVDIDGEPWASPPAIGCDEYHAGAVGPLTLNILTDNTNAAKGFIINFIGDIRGNCNASRWEFGDGIILSNRPYASHSWATSGDYPVVLRAYNGSFPGGAAATQVVHVVDGVYYVALSNPSPSAPFTSWAAAATNIQDAVDAAVAGSTVLVSNGLYRTGGRVVYGTLTNRLVINKVLTVQSVNGPASTAIEGYQVPLDILGDNSIRCVYLANHAVLSGFTLTNGATLRDWSEAFVYELYAGGGVLCEAAGAVVSNCTIIGCSASDYGGGAARGTLNDCVLRGNFSDYGATGGGAHGANLNRCLLADNRTSQAGGGAGACTLNRCVLTNNSADPGGGTYGSTLNNCTLTGNSAYNGGGDCASTLNNCTLVGNFAQNAGGGANSSALNNCIVFDNTAANAENYAGGGLNFCCTTPLPGDGAGNFTNSPLLVNEAGGNLRLLTNSPCINAGDNASAPTGADLDGNPRIAGGTVDIGAYEFQYPASLIAYAWLQQYGLAHDGTADHADGDGDGMNNWQEWRAGTTPNDPLSVLRLSPPTATNNPSGIFLTWQSVRGRTYFLQRSTNLVQQPVLETVATDLPGETGTTSYIDTSALGPGPFFYRVGVK